MYVRIFRIETKRKREKMGRLKHKVTPDIYSKFFLEPNQAGGIYHLPVYEGKMSMHGGGIRFGHLFRRAASAIGKGAKNVARKTTKKAVPALTNVVGDILKNPPSSKDELLKKLSEGLGVIAHAAAESASEEINAATHQKGGVYPSPGNLKTGNRSKKNKPLVEYHQQ